MEISGYGPAADQWFTVRHEALTAATSFLPQQVAALDGTHRAATDRELPTEAFGLVDGAAEAGRQHLENIVGMATRLIAARECLKEMINGITGTNTGTQDLANRQQAEQQEQNGLLAQAGGEGFRPSATLIDDGRNIQLTPRDPSWPTVVIPNAVGATEGFGMGDSVCDLTDPGHTSSVTSRIEVPFAESGPAVSEALRTNPTPGPDQPASPQGTLNNALDMFPGAGYVANGNVHSHLVPSPDPSRFTDTVVNYTRADHWLAPGFIMRRGAMTEDGMLMLQTYGEGAGWSQHGLLGPGWRPLNWATWEANHHQIENEIIERLDRR